MPKSYTQIGQDIFQGNYKKEIDFKFLQGFLIVEVKYNGIWPLKFLFDTGAQNTIIFDRLTAELSPIKYERSIKIMGSDLMGTLDAKIARNLEFNFKSLPSLKRDVIVMDEDILKMHEIIGEFVHGIIGADFFRGLIVEINYKKDKIILHNPKRYNKKKLSEFTKMETEFHSGKPYIISQASLNGKDTISLKLLLDTGASISTLFHNDTHPMLILPETAIKGNLGKGLSGDLMGFMSRAKSIELANFSFKNTLVHFQALKPQLAEDQPKIIRNGLIGNFLLDRFTLVIDYVNEAVYMKAEKKYNRAFLFDKSGLTIFALGTELNQFVIKDIIVGSPAEEAGLQPDDEILKIGIWSAKLYTLDRISRLLSSKSGKTIKLKIKRGDKKFTVKFKLRDLF